MPRPPDLPDFDKLNFVTGYMMQGCVPPFWLFVEFAKEPAGDLALVLLGLDIQDIVKEWLRPVRHRVWEPDRHGKKRWRWRTSFDPNEYISTRVRARDKIYPGLKLPGARAVFAISDFSDKIAIQAAVVEGLTDIGFQGILGVLQMHPERCPNMPFITRRTDGEIPIPGSLQTHQVIEAFIFENGQHFQAGGPFAYTTFNSKFTLGWSGIVRADAPFGVTDWQAGIWSNQRGLIATGSSFTVAPGETFHASVAGDGEPGEMLWPCRKVTLGTSFITQFKVFGFGGGLW